jgi:outer membrane protein assembly factor BamA
LLAIALSVACAFAQQSADEMYNGMTVSKVVLVAQPSVDVNALRPLVVQKESAPYSIDDIQKSAAALQAAGKFTRVSIEVSPEAEGLRVMFILEPVLYIGTIDFPGATREFSYQRLLQTVNYPPQEPFQAERVTKGEKALEKFFAREGYFASQVKAQSEFESQRQLANVTYNVTLGPHAKYGKIEITGPDDAEVKTLVGALHSLRARIHGANISQGKRYDPDHLDAATRFLQDTLGRQNHLAAQVHMTPPAYDAATNRAALHWNVKLGPEVKVSVEGAKISQRTLRSLVPIYEENSFDQDLVQEGRQKLISYFQGKGYFDAKVDAQTSQTPTEISLVYHVDRGDRFRVASVRVTGNSHSSQRELAGQVVVQKARFLSHGKFSNDLVDRTVKNLTAYYQSTGYADVKVESRVRKDGNNLNVTFQIKEGELTRVEKLSVEGNDTQPLNKIAPCGFYLKEGLPFSQARLDKDRSEIIANYLKMGYPNAALRWSVDRAADAAHRVIVTFEIDEGPKVQIANVNFLGAQHTKARFLEKNTVVKAGEPLNEAKLLGTESALYNLGIFDWADVAPMHPITDQTSEDVQVKVHEAKRNSISYGFGLQYTPVGGGLSSGIVALPGLPTLGLPKGFQPIEKTVFSPLGSVEYSRLNILGRAETASIATSLSILDQRAAFTFTDPQFVGLTWSSLLNLSAERSAQNPLFTARLGTASFQLEKTLDAAKTRRLQFRYAFQRTTLTNLLIQNFIPPEDESVHSSMFSVTFIRDTRDKPLDAHRGFFQTLDFGISPRAIGSSDSFARFFGQSAYYRELNPWLVWANNVRFGIVDSLGSASHVPISERFFSGGADSLRGFPLNGAGPQVTATLCKAANDPSSCTAEITAPEGGKQLFIINSEGRFPLPFYKGLGGVVFYDGGNVFSNIGFNHFFNNYSNSVGVGLRYQTPVGPVRIDLGKNLEPVPGLHSTQFFITLGQSF